MSFIRPKTNYQNNFEMATIQQSGTFETKIEERILVNLRLSEGNHLIM